jgi:superfamily II DNA/RNA helicase
VQFSDFALHPLILQTLAADGYAEPTPVQEAAIPAAMDGRDLLATAQTGTGKTAAFLLPSLHRMATIPAAAFVGRRPEGAPRILVLTPTRELARQVLQSVRKHGKLMRLNTVEIVGGMPYRDQLRLLARPVDVVVATPGRLLDHLERGRLDLSGVEVLILDEADRMLDMGFLEDVEAVAAACGTERQTLLFTATLDRRMAKLAERLLRDPVRIAIATTTATELRIEQRLHHADDLAHKRRLLHHFAASPEVAKAIVFTATKRDADALAQDLTGAGHAAGALHGDLNQGQRNRTLDQLRSGQIRLLVATDVAARGIDVRDISHVINFDLPRSPEDYVHRIGRTGRAGAEGVAISFASHADRVALLRIQQYTKVALPVHLVPGLEPRRPAGGPPPRTAPRDHAGPRHADHTAPRHADGRPKAPARAWSNKPGGKPARAEAGGRKWKEA